MVAQLISIGILCITGSRPTLSRSRFRNNRYAGPKFQGTETRLPNAADRSTAVADTVATTGLDGLRWDEIRDC